MALVDYGNQARPRGYYGFWLILPALTWVCPTPVRSSGSGTQALDAKRANGYHKTLQKPTGMSHVQFAILTSYVPLDFWVICAGCPAHVAGNSSGGLPIDKMPVGTYVMVMRRICYQRKKTVPSQSIRA